MQPNFTAGRIEKLYRSQVLTVLDQGHFAHGHLPEIRYDVADPEMQSLLDTVRLAGILQAGEVWHIEDRDVNFVIFGTRRTIALDLFNQERMAAGQDPIPMPYKFVEKKTFGRAEEAEALDRMGIENSSHKADDWLTVAYALKKQIDLGVEPEVLKARYPMVRSIRLLKQLAHPKGITAAKPLLQQALGRGAITERQAIRLATLPLDQQEISVLYKVAKTPVARALLNAAYEQGKFWEVHAVSKAIKRSEDISEVFTDAHMIQRDESGGLLPESLKPEKFNRDYISALNTLQTATAQADTKVRTALVAGSIRCAALRTLADDLDDKRFENFVMYPGEVLKMLTNPDYKPADGNEREFQELIWVRLAEKGKPGRKAKPQVVADDCQHCPDNAA